MGEQREKHHIDLMVGRKIKKRRLIVGLSQDELARKIGVTFQQVQKYEKAANRVSCSVIWKISKALMVPTSYFFDENEEYSTIEDRTILRMIERINSASTEKIRIIEMILDLKGEKDA